MNDHQLRDEYERSLNAAEIAGQPSAQPSSALPLERLEALVSREDSEAERLRALDIAMSTAEGRREFEVAWAARRAALPKKQKRVSTTWLAAAAALLLTTTSSAYWLANRASDSGAAASDSEVMRGTNARVTLVAPRGELANSTGVRFTWRAVPSSGRYLMVLVDSQGNEVFASTTRDTAVTLPDSIKLQAGGVYLWWVQTELADGTTATAVTEKITVKNGSR
jgi:hypothetical protein